MATPLLPALAGVALLFRGRDARMQAVVQRLAVAARSGTDEAPLAQGLRPFVTVAIDMAGSTAFHAANGAERFGERRHARYGLFAESISPHGDHVIRFIADGVMAADLAEEGRAALRSAGSRGGHRPARLRGAPARPAGRADGHPRKLGLDESLRAELADLGRRVAMPRRQGMTRKNRDRLRALRDPATLRRLIDLPEKLIGKAPRLKPQAGALAREDALAISILLHCPLRVGNLAGLHIGKHLQRPDSRRLFIVLVEDEVKNGQPIEFEAPPHIRKMLDRHLAARTPLLCPPGTPWLFPRRDGSGPVAPSTLSTRLSQRIQHEAGIVMNPHLFRHLAAMIWLDANPGGYEAARRLLGHSAVSTTINVHSGLEARTALRAYGDVLAAKRGARP